MKNILLFGAIWGILLSGEALAVEAPTTSSLFRIKDGAVAIPHVDEDGTTEPELFRVHARDFKTTAPNPIFRHRLHLVTEGPADSPIVDVPPTTKRLQLVARGQAVEHIFPRIAVSAVEAGGREIPIGETFIQSNTQQGFNFGMPAEVAGKSVRFRVRVVNHTDANNGRDAFVAHMTGY